jgi:hypothetical protein
MRHCIIVLVTGLETSRVCVHVPAVMVHRLKHRDDGI